MFNAENHEFIGKIEAIKSVAAFYAPEALKEEFEAAVATKKRNIKITNSNYVQKAVQLFCCILCRHPAQTNFANGFLACHPLNKSGLTS